LPLATQKPGDMAGDCGLADPLAASDDCERGHVERSELNRFEAEIGARVPRSSGERPRREAKPAAGIQHRIVGEVEHELGAGRLQPFLEVGKERNSVRRLAPKLFRTAQQNGTDNLVLELDERVAHDLGVMLPVDEGESSHRRVELTSSSILVVYFSYSSVSIEN
jgi:hypothetical protein